MIGTIVFEGVWKRFHRGPAHDSLRDLIPALIRRASSRARTNVKLGEGDFWAVRDVSFEVEPGQALGIIGGNGAGKSTILKLLTKVLTPNRGRAEIQGRVGALIEVSAGFHGDLTGRENVFLQGAIMGMPQRLIRERFDDIVDFSGVAASIDTPVKRYSTGMNARLGFAIAIHLEPEALIIDEVLSVGDAEFQGRAFDRVRQLVAQEVPVVIVSHQLDRVVELCSDCILLRHGEVAYHGTATDAVDRYMRGITDKRTTSIGAPVGLSLDHLHGRGPLVVASGDSYEFELEGEVTDPESPLNHLVGIMVTDSVSNQRLFVADLRAVNAHPTDTGRFKAEFLLQANLPPGFFRIEAYLWGKRENDVVLHGPTVLLEVKPGIPFVGSHQLNIRPI